jgi:hypothetical protein
MLGVGVLVGGCRVVSDVNYHVIVLHFMTFRDMKKKRSSNSNGL